jgi:PIN domain nuclease of toxin-antitoxin system
VKYLLDTHAVLWIAEDSPRLPARIRALARNHDADTFGLAAISLLEIARLAKAGEISLSPDPSDWLEDIAHRFAVLPLTPAIAWTAVNLDWPHKDPADRLICATAREHKLTLISNDREITRWSGVPVVW